MALAHGYGPVADFEARLRIAWRAASGRVWVNRYGYLAGDQVLKGLARLLQHRMRCYDAIGRFGGEEFLVILSGTDGETTRRIMDEVRTAFASLQQGTPPREFQVSFSCGIAVLSPGAGAAEVVADADAALYRAKEAGRNRVEMA